MKKKSVKRIIIQFIALVLLVQVINISIDPMDPVSDKLGRLATHEDLSINDVESIYEFVSEQFLGIDVPEQDEDDESAFIKIMDFYFTQSSIEIKNEYQPYDISFFTIEKNLNSIVLDLNSPPPKAA